MFYHIINIKLLRIFEQQWEERQEKKTILKDNPELLSTYNYE